MATLQDKQSGQTFEVPDSLSPEDRARLLERLLNDPNLRPRQVSRPEMQAVGELRRETRRETEASGLEQRFGAPLKRTEEGRVAELDRPGVRFDVARSAALQDRIAKLRDKFPNTEIEVVDDPDGNTVVGLREPGQDEFVLLDSDQVFSLSDVADIAGVTLGPDAVTQIAAAIATRGRSLVKRVATQVFAGGIGRALDVGIEAGRGFESRDLDEIFRDVSIVGLAGGTGELLAALPRRGVRGALGQGVVETSPEEQAAITTMREGGVRGPTLGQISPLAERMEMQSAQTSKPLQQFRLGQTGDALRDIKAVRDAVGNVDDLSDDELVEVVNRMKDDLFRIVTDVDISPEKAGRAITAGRKEFKRVWRGFVGRRYDRALAEGENATFDLSPARSVAKDARKGVTGRGKATEEELTGADGLPLTDDLNNPIVPTKEHRVQIRKLRGELKEAVDDLLALDPDVRAFEGNSAFEQVKELRTRFFDVKNATVDGKETIDNRLAGRIWDALTEVMQNPVSGNPRFRLLLRSANAANRRFERILEIADIAKIAKTTDPGSLVDNLAKPGKAFTLRTLKRVLPDEAYDKLQRGFKAKLLRDPDSIETTLNGFRKDREALSLLLRPGEVQEMERLAVAYKRFQASAVQKAVRSQARAADRVRTIIREGDAEDLANIVDKAGGKNSSLGRALGAGTVQFVLDAAEKTVKGRSVIDPEAAMNAIRTLDRRGILDATLQPGTKKALLDREKMLSFLPRPGDPGAAIRAQELVSQASEVITVPVQGAGALRSFYRGATGLARNALFGRMFISEPIRRILVGAGQRQLDLTTLRALSAVATATVAEMEGRSRAEREE